MKELRIIRNDDITRDDLEDVIRVKSTAWPYPHESQKRWIAENLSADDLHVLLANEAEVLAYMNLVKITFEANDAEYLAYGVGNVCAVEKNHGYGTELMNRVCKFLSDKKMAGMLFCKASLVPFYEKCGWNIIEGKSCVSPHLPDGVHIMTFLSPCNPTFFRYEGKLF